MEEAIEQLQEEGCLKKSSEGEEVKTERKE